MTGPTHSMARRTSAIALSAATLLAALPMPTRAATSDLPICIRTYEIDHTEIPDDSTILFYMRDHSLYRNRLPQRCVGLKVATNGFTYEPTNPGTEELCGNLGTFRVNDGPGPGFGGLSSGEVCMFGPFDRVAAPAAK